MNLPPELLENICSYLQNSELKNMKLVSKHFHECLTGYIERQKIYDVVLQRCFVCKKISVRELPMVCTFWKKQGEHKEIDICSKKCRRDFIERLPIKCFCMILSFRNHEEPIEQSLPS